MEKLKLYKFRENCCCCYINVKKGINVCLCHLTFCDTHFKIHLTKTSCSLLYRVEDNNKLEITDSGLSDDEINKAIERLKLILKCNNYDEKVIFKTEEVECPHILHISVHDKLQLGKIDDLLCNECEISKNLYICFTCGFIGCGRVQFGIEGNGHAQHHFKITNHSVFVAISSITPEYVCDTYCYQCDNFVINPICESKIQCTDFAKECASWTNQKDVIDESKNSIPSPFLGIKNVGNTCFISSTLQLLGFIGIKENIDFDSHFELCDKTNPLNCIYCQACKIFNEMKKGSNLMDIRTITISDMLVLIWSTFPYFKKNIQEDAGEFLLAFLNLFDEAEFLGIFPKLSHFLKFETENHSSCDKCKTNEIRKEKQFVILAPFNVSLQACIEEYFNEYVSLCSCGEEKVFSTRIISLPKYLTVLVKKFKFENQAIKKITESLSVDEVNLIKFIKRPSLSNYFIQDLVEKGFNEGAVLLGLSNCTNFDNKEEIVENYAKVNRTDPIYNVQGSIVHTGNSIESGHYMWYVKNEDTFYLVNDMKISEEGVEWLEQSYILCLY